MRVGVARVADHDVGINIDGVDGVGDGHAVAGPEDVEDVAAIAFGTVGDENFIVLDFQSAVAEVVLRDGASEKIVALFRSIAAEGVTMAHFIDRGVQRFEAGGGERFGHITDAAADDFGGGVRVGFAEGFDAARDFGEEVAGFEF